MRGRILGYDQNSGEGQISGADNQRYTFDREQWRTDLQPAAGQTVDFEVSENRALSVYRLGGVGESASGKNKIVAALLAFFLGSLGIHKFYLGKNGAGLIMLLVSIFGAILLFIPTFIIGLIAFIEFIIYLVTPDDEFERRYIVGDKSWF